MDQKGKFSPRATKLAMVEPSLEMGNVSKEFLVKCLVSHIKLRAGFSIENDTPA